MANVLVCAACDSCRTVGPGAHEQYEGQEHRSMQDVDSISGMCTLLMRGGAAGEIMIEVLVAAAAIASNATTVTTAAPKFVIPTCSVCSSPNLCLQVRQIALIIRACHAITLTLAMERMDIMYHIATKEQVCGDCLLLRLYLSLYLCIECQKSGRI